MIKSPLIQMALVGLAVVSLGIANTSAAPRVSVADHENANLFDVNEPVKFKVALKGFPEGAGKLEAAVTDFSGETKTVNMPLDGGKSESVTLDLGDLDPGYYDLVIRAEVAGSNAKSEKRSFGIVHFVNRTAAEARKQGMRFGLKTFQIGEPGVWWRKGTVWDISEVVDATAKAGIQWTRHSLNEAPDPDQPGIIGTSELIENHPVNVVLKVEGFPAEAFDEQRYGPLKEFKKKPFSRRSVPLKAPYQKWLKEQIAAIPPEQNVFEIGNEVWNYMSAEEFAEWAQMAVEAIKEVRPNAIVGVDVGIGKYAHKFLAAGGMKGMNAAFSHPYSFTPLPEHRIRGLIRAHHDILKRRTGEEFDLYVTEYGWPVAPKEKGKKRNVTEAEQAARTTRVSLMLYAEDVKALVPHMMGDREQEEDNWDQWFGFFRLKGQPRPVMVAHATAARMIDGSKFVGDLWYGPGVGAMLFERDGTHTLALWTLEENRKVEVDAGVPEVTRVSLMGKEEKVATSNGKVALDLSGDVTYLVGVSADLATQAAPPGSNLREDRWSKRQGSFPVKQLAQSPTIDADLSEWEGVEGIKLEASGGTGSAVAKLAWDQENVYLALEAVGQGSDPKQYLDFGLGVRPDRQIDMGSVAIYDFHFTVPSPANQKDGLRVKNDGFDDDLKVPETGHESGLAWTSKATNDGWTAELAIPVKFLQGIPELKAGEKLTGRLILKKVHDKKDQVLFSEGGDAPTREWPSLILE